MSERKKNLSCAPGKNLIKRKGYTTKAGTKVAKTEFCIEDQGTKGVRSRGAKQGPFKDEKPWIQREGKLGGPGYTDKSQAKRRKILKGCEKEYGYRSCLGSIMVLLRSSEIQGKDRKVLESDKKWLMKEYGGPGSFGPENNPALRESNPKEVKQLKAKLLR